MGLRSAKPRAGELTWVEKTVERVLTLFPPKFAAFWLRFIGVFVGRRMSMMAAVSAFWAIFAFPWIIIVFTFALSKISRFMGKEAIQEVEETVIDAVNHFLTPEAAQQFAIPILDSLIHESLTGLGIVGVIVALWSGSKAAMSLMDAISFIEENVAPIGYVKRRALALALLLGAVVAMSIVAPLVVVGPRQVGEWLNLSSEMVWVIVVGLGLVIVFALLLVLYKTATIHFKHWNRYLPGAVLATLASAVGVIGLGIYVRRMFETNAFLGTLLTPIAMMTAAYVLCLIVLAGAVFNYIKSVGPKVDSALAPAMMSALETVAAKEKSAAVQND